ncbi:hypothetical protein GCM10009000_035400 [Halobacterium noricense]
MAHFHAKPSECSERGDDESITVADEVIELVESDPTGNYFFLIRVIANIC